MRLLIRPILHRGFHECKASSCYRGNYEKLFKIRSEVSISGQTVADNRTTVVLRKWFVHDKRTASLLAKSRSEHGVTSLLFRNLEHKSSGSMNGFIDPERYLSQFAA